MYAPESFAKEFIKAFPEYKAQFLEHLDTYEEFLGHVFFGDVLNMDLINLISGGSDQERLKRLFDFMERMMREGNNDVQNIITVTILERLGDDSEILKEAYRYMGTKTRTASEEIEQYWGREYPS